MNLEGMAAPEMCVLHEALHPNLAEKPNLGALLISHFCKQRNQDFDGIPYGGLIIHIDYQMNIDLRGFRAVGTGPTKLNQSVMLSSSFMRPAPHYNKEHSYYCHLVTGGMEHVCLPLRNILVCSSTTMVLSLDQINEARSLAGYMNFIGEEPKGDPRLGCSHDSRRLRRWLRA
jgi:hypothetical protein